MAIGHMRLTKVLMNDTKPELTYVFAEFMRRGTVVHREYDAKQLIYDYTLDHPDFLLDDEHAHYVMHPVSIYNGWNREYRVGTLYKLLANGDRVTVKIYD